MMTIIRRATPPPMIPASSLWSDFSGLYRWQENCEGLLDPALFSASTHTLVPASKDPTKPFRELAPNSWASLSLPSITTLYPDTTEDGAHHLICTFPLCSPSVTGSSTSMRGALGATSDPLIPGQRHPVSAASLGHDSWSSEQES